MQELAFEKYFSLINEIFNKIKVTQHENIIKASDILSDCTKNDGIIHAFGVGHSHLVAEDIFWRGATLANIHAILEPSMTGHAEITKSEYMEKLEGAGALIVNYHKLSPPDAIIVISNSGNNIVPIDVAIEASKRGVKVISITSIDYENHLRTLHSSGRKLKDVVDVVIDNCCPVGDSALSFDELPMKVGAVSTVAGTFIINSLMAQVVENLISQQIKPDVYFNGSLAANSMEIEDYNQKLVDKYYLRIRNL